MSWQAVDCPIRNKTQKLHFFMPHLSTSLCGFWVRPTLIVGAVSKERCNDCEKRAAQIRKPS